MFGLSLPLISHILPHKCEITTVVGTPIHVNKIDTPTDKDVNDLLEAYIVALNKLYEENVAKYSPHVKTPLRIL